MPLFEVGDDELIPFRRVRGGPDLYEKEIEDLLWQNLEEFVGVPLFPVARQPVLQNGFQPDLVALDSDGRVHVIEVKRAVDRRQLAQGLEYAGWARTTSLDELAAMFHRGAEVFFAAWTEFTESNSPKLVEGPPQLVLVARDFDSRTKDALSYLTENHLPITVLRVTIYEDRSGRRFVDIDSDHEIELLDSETDDSRKTSVKRTKRQFKIDGRPVVISDLVEAGLLLAETVLTWKRPSSEDEFNITVTADGELLLEDGRIFSNPSGAAKAVNSGAWAGWGVWRTPDGHSLGDLRDALIARSELNDAGEADGTRPGGMGKIDA